MTSKLWCAICGYNRKPKGSLVYGCPFAEKYKDWHTKWCDIIGFDETTVKKEPGNDANPLNFRYDIQNPVCSIHFEASCFNEQHKMMENALPTLFLGHLSKAVKLDKSVASENDSPPSDLDEITDKMQMAAVDSGISDSSDDSCSSPPPLTPIHANIVQGPTPILGSMDVDSDLPAEASDWSEHINKCMRIEENSQVDTSPNAFNFDDESTFYRPEGGEHLKRSKPGDLPNGIVQQSPVLTRRVTLRRSSRNDAQPKFLREDESPYFLPTEAYVEDYAVPLTLLRLIEKQPVAICGKVYCRLGCICSSLHSSMEIERNHCQKPSCILECVCRQRLRQKGVDESSALAMVFFSGTDQGFDRDAEFESLTLTSEDNRQQSTALSLVDENTKLKKTLFENSTAIKNLQLQLRSKEKELATLKKQIGQTAGCLPGLLESLETTKAHLEFINQIQTVDVGSQPIEAKPLVDASGIYQGVFPFKEYELDLLAEKNTVNMFIRTLMRKLFSDDYLATKSCSLMEKKHHDAITDATLKRFKTYHRRKSLDQPSRAEKLTANHVKFVMRSEFANQYTQMKKKLGL